MANVARSSDPVAIVDDQLRAHAQLPAQPCQAQHGNRQNEKSGKGVLEGHDENPTGYGCGSRLYVKFSSSQQLPCFRSVQRSPAGDTSLPICVVAITVA